MKTMRRIMKRFNRVNDEYKIGRLESSKTEPMIKLSPYRTFREIEQPESLFLLRMKRERGGVPYVALFEADGGQWKHDAITKIKMYFKESRVIAERNIDVIA